MNTHTTQLHTRLLLAACAFATLGSTVACDEELAVDRTTQLEGDFEEEGTGGDPSEYWDATSESFPEDSAESPPFFPGTDDEADDPTLLADSRSESPGEPEPPGSSTDLAGSSETRADGGEAGRDLAAPGPSGPCEPDSPHLELAEDPDLATDADTGPGDPTRIEQDAGGGQPPGTVPDNALLHG